MSEAPSAPRERRRYPRCIVGMPVQAVRADTPQDDPRRMVGLHVLDLSRGGVGAASQEAIKPAQPLVLFFPPVGPGRGRDTPGMVVRCQERGTHYAVGIAFEEPWSEHEDVLVR